uniref:Uncharacterized protein n=1 Tax=Solanum lycopersicum TaxID=4081 RepID=A0A3Q7GJQ0_SOLLC
MHTAKKWQLKCQSGVYWKSADASLIEQQAKTIWLLDIELPEVTATPLGDPPCTNGPQGANRSSSGPHDDAVGPAAYIECGNN